MRPLPELLARLESYACYELRRKVIPATESIRLFGREAYVGAALAKVDRHCVAVPREYRTFRQMTAY